MSSTAAEYALGTHTPDYNLILCLQTAIYQLDKEQWSKERTGTDRTKEKKKMDKTKEGKK